MSQGGQRSNAAAQHGKQDSIQISRSSGASYDRPERARTSHACEPCRERKTKCDGERPSCRRCLNTGTPCLYGYGKGWKKRKVAEDLSATSKRLARYEALLTTILPVVSPAIQAMIEAARNDQDNADSESSGSEESTPTHRASSLDPSTSSLTLPQPKSSVVSATKAPSSAHAMATLPASVSPTDGVRHLHRSSVDEAALDRLPSIRPDGMLIEVSQRNRPLLNHVSDHTSLSNRLELSPLTGHAGSPDDDGQ